MGRYYHGTIEGKFMFGIQSSTDADFFGVEGIVPETVNYYFDEDNLPAVKEGIDTCINTLGKYKDLIDEFSTERDSYNNEQLMEFLDKKLSIHHAEETVRYYLEWWARLKLGKEILECIEKKGYCDFDAELS